MNITLLTTIFPRWEGDYRGAFVGRMAACLSRQSSLSITVVAPSGKNGLLYERWGELVIRRFRYWFDQNKQNIAYGDHDSFTNIRRSIVGQLQLIFYIVSFFIQTRKMWSRTDVFHCQWTFTAIYPIILNKWANQKKPVIVTCRGSDLRLLPGWFNRYVFRHVVAVVYPSPLETISRYQNRFGTDILRYAKEYVRFGARMVFDPMDEQAFQKTRTDLGDELKLNGKIVYLWLARLDEMKNPVTAIEAVAILRKERNDFLLLIVGFGPLEQNVIDTIKENDLQDCVKFLGPRSDVLNFYQLADIYIATNAYDNVWSTTIAEAMLLDCALILSDAGNTRNVFAHQRDCLITPVGNAARLADALNMLSSDQNLRYRLAKNARDTLTRYRRLDRQVIEDLLSLYTEACQIERLA